MGLSSLQVILLGDGMDTRPYRLLWPPGTLIFVVAPKEVHEQAEATLKSSSTPAHVMRGCLLRRVILDWGAATASSSSSSSMNAPSSTSSDGIHLLEVASTAGNGSSSSGLAVGVPAAQGGSGDGVATMLIDQLERAGFRGDRLSVWAVQGLRDQGLGMAHLQELFAEVTNCAAFHSLFVGELPGPMTKQQAENLLAEMGLLGAVQMHTAADAGSYGRLHDHGKTNRSGGNGLMDGWLFTAQQLRLSLQQMGVYEQHMAEAEATDEDFFGHFS